MRCMPYCLFTWQRRKNNVLAPHTHALTPKLWQVLHSNWKAKTNLFLMRQEWKEMGDIKLNSNKMGKKSRFKWSDLQTNDKKDCRLADIYRCDISEWKTFCSQNHNLSVSFGITLLYVVLDKHLNNVKDVSNSTKEKKGTAMLSSYLKPVNYQAMLATAVVKRCNSQRRQHQKNANGHFVEQTN